MPSARSAEQRFFPLDEELALLPGGLTPYMQEHLVRLGALVPFEPAAELLHDLLGVQISPAQVRRITEGAGAAYVEFQNQAAERIEREAPEAPAGAEKMEVSVDGAMVPLRHGEWGEVKTLVVGEVAPAVLEKGEWVVHTRQLSYFSRLATAERFEQLCLVELHRRGVEKAGAVGAVVDGAEWEQGLIDYHCPQAVRILDFPHAGQRIGQVAEAVWGEGSAQTQQWTNERLHQLKHQGPDAILAELRDLRAQHPDQAVLAENLGYLEKREALMQYPTFQAQGWPIGSGIVESGNKLVVEARLKGAGMHWDREQVNPMLGLRNILCSDRWSDEWQVLAQQLRQQAQVRRKKNREKRRQEKAPPVVDVGELQPVEPAQKTLEEQPASAPQRLPKSGSKKPAANHPWRHSPFGRALYEPSPNARK